MPRAKLYAPVGGVSLAGQYHLGGQEIRPEAQDSLSEGDLHTILDVAETDPAAARALFESARSMPAKAAGRGEREEERRRGNLHAPEEYVHPSDYPHYTLGHGDRPLDPPLNPPPRQGGRNQKPLTPAEGRSNLPPELRLSVTDEDAMSLTPHHAAELVGLFNQLPPTREFAGAALLGQAKRGWYADAAKAIVNLFGSDAPRFAGLLAATSPVKSVKSNLRNAVAIWAEWKKMTAELGREPTSQELAGWLTHHFENVGEKGSGGRVNAFGQETDRKHYHDVFTGGQYYLDTEIPNIVRALTKPGAGGKDFLSGPKVSSFKSNLLGELEEVTNDTWMAAFGGIAQSLVGGRTVQDNFASGQQVRNGRYIALSAKQRQAAEMLNQNLAPGERPWQPAEVQETVWSSMRALSYLVGASRASGNKPGPRVDQLHTPASALDSLTHEFVQGNADFVNLLLNDTVTSEALVRLDPQLGKVLERLAKAQGRKPRPHSGRAVQGVPGVYHDALQRVAGRAAMSGGTHTRPQETYAKKKRRRRPPTPAQRDRDAQALAAADGYDRAAGIWAGKDGTGGTGEPSQADRSLRADADAVRDTAVSRRRKYAADPAGGALVAASGNQDNDLSFEQALQRARSGDQKVFKAHLDQFIQQQGLKAKTETAVGDWEDGAEHSVLSTFDGTADPETVKYLAAWTGLLGNQRAVLSFVPEPRGLDSVYAVQVPETNLGKVRQTLSRAGIPFRTIVPGKRGARVVIYDQRRELRDKVSQWAGAYGAPVRESIGSGQYIGGGSRSAARRKYRDLIARYEESRKAAAPAGGPVRAR